MAVAAAASRCTGLLNDAQADRTMVPRLRLDLEGVLVRFGIWTGNVGVFAPETASLDYRLRDDMDVVDILVSMLKSLGESLGLAIRPPLLEEAEEAEEPSSVELQQEEEPTEDSEGSLSTLSLDSEAENSENAGADSGEATSADASIKKANEIIDRLYRMVSVIRKPPSSSRENARVRDFIAKMQARGEMEELDDVEDHARSHLNARFHDASHVLVERLVAAVVFRRMKLLYRQRHQQKLRQGFGPAANPFPHQTDAGHGVSGPGVPLAGSQGDWKVQDHHHEKMARPWEIREATAPSKMLSATNASSINKPTLASYAKSIALSGVTHSAVARRRQLDVPGPPSKRNGDHQRSECPFCFTLVDKEETEEPRWTCHILKDIDPYVCLFETCGEGDVLFKSVQEWLSHMQWRHTMVWACQVPGHEAHTYDTPSEMEEHIRKDHPDSFTESQLPDLIKHTALPAPDTFAALAVSNRLTVPKQTGHGDVSYQCPICLNFHTARSEDRAENSNSQAASDIQDHILEHLESIALLSLPVEDSQSKSLARSNSRQSGNQRGSVSLRDDLDLPSALFDDASINRHPDSDDDVPRQSDTSAGDGEPETVPSDGLQNETLSKYWETEIRQINQGSFPEPNQDVLLLGWQARQIRQLLNNDQVNTPSGTRYLDKEHCLRSLLFDGMDDRQHVIRRAYPGTCDWLFSTDQFQEWRNRANLPFHNGVLWIKGKPGVGKSVLMKHALRHCEKIFGGQLIVTHFFHGRGTSLQKTLLGMLRSIVYQLLDKDDTLYERFLPIYAKQRTDGKGGPEWSRAQLEDFIRSIMDKPQSKPLIFLIGALNECDGRDLRNAVGFLESLSIEAVHAGFSLRICLSSRHYPYVSMRKTLELTVEASEEHDRDIATYIARKLKGHDDDLEAKVWDRAGGIFLWVVIVVSQLNKAYVGGHRSRATHIVSQVELPCLKVEFGELLHEQARLNKDDPDKAETLRMLQWVLLSRWPLKPEELFFAVLSGTAPEYTGPWDRSKITDHVIQRRITSSSKGLIEVQTRGAAFVQFIHISVIGLLFRYNWLQMLDETLEPDPFSASHGRLWDRCWSDVKQLDTTSTSKRHVSDLNDRYPFLRYATTYLFDHAEEALSGGAMREEIARWLQLGNDWFEWWKICLRTVDIHRVHRYSDSDTDAGLLYMLSFCGYESLVTVVLPEGDVDVNARGGTYGNALQAASVKNHIRIVQYLLDHGADVNAQGGRYSNALEAASANGYTDIVQLLLEHSADGPSPDPN
ncbi:uncharacterized protein B0H64DRAFT_102714 [Chaetomium fimeti]|uniref:Nephrocystin 3-like N-terminal domain-containing protein n=1 Tax=Chaetomium fimeti TaxID=1854472 RepID=A0AAE0LWV1_9PEZI|nr:hypothetical protein B0H64DRAFT_102714 [Chaetomium fimeti]